MAERIRLFEDENSEDRPTGGRRFVDSGNPNEKPSDPSEYAVPSSSDLNYPQPVRTPRFEKETSVGQPESNQRQQPQIPPEQRYDGPFYVGG
ncbi:MAG TPA: hypothetical protein VLG16_02650 [Candidatus Saccharimonadales bacterium]|nr:hypothetical protein [Candidatus Saccharimonadales bacterium]